MLRLRYFWSGLSLASKLQFLVLLLILGYAFVSNDLNPRNHLLGFKLWQITVPIICGAILLGRLLLPIMMWNPVRAGKVLGGFGLIVLAFWIFGAGQRPRTMLSYLLITTGMWIDASCWYWFQSELHMRAAVEPTNGPNTEMTDEEID